MNQNTEQEALNQVLHDIINTEDAREQNLAIDRYLKLNLAIGLRTGKVDANALSQVASLMKPKH